MILQTLATITSIGLAGLSAPQSEPETQMAQAAPFVTTQGVVAPRASADYMTTPQGCSYRRTQAPGYPARWILIVNPQRLGLPKRPRGCKGMY